MATLFTANLTGAQETPPTGSQASGEGTVVWDPAAQTADYTFTVRGLDFGPITGAGETTPSAADDVTNAHFHNAPPGVAGPVVFGQIGPAQDLDDLVIFQNADSVVQNADGSWTVSGVWDPGDPANVPIGAFADLLTAAQPGSDVALYWNVHTTAFPAGEIRGQLVADLAGFDRAFYLAANPDVAAAGVDPLAHYEQFGWREGRDPSPDFDVGAYLAANPDVAAAGVEPLQHYLTVGIQEGRQAFAVGSGEAATGGGDDGTLAATGGGDDGTLAAGGAPTSVNDLSPLG
jgi:hypothetical protein